MHPQCTTHPGSTTSLPPPPPPHLQHSSGCCLPPALPGPFQAQLIPHNQTPPDPAVRPCDQVGEIVRLAPKARQTVLFSATMTEEVQRLATLSLRQPVRLAADEPSTAPVRLSQEVLRLKVRPGGLELCRPRSSKPGRAILMHAGMVQCGRVPHVCRCIALSAVGQRSGGWYVLRQRLHAWEVGLLWPGHPPAARLAQLSCCFLLWLGGRDEPGCLLSCCHAASMHAQ